jgi:uncharacterized protein YdaU (DUF1376 family)
LDELYSTEQRIPTEEDAVRICQAVTAEEKWAVTSVLEKFFKKTLSGFTNNRYEKELKTRKDWCKWQKNHRTSKPDKGLTVRPMSSRYPSPSPLPLKTEEKSKPVSADADAHVSSRIMFEIFEQERGSLPGVRELTPDRLSKSRTRLLNHKADQQKFLAEFRAAVRKAGQLRWPEWRPDFDWFLGNDSNYLKVLEGKYDNWGGNHGTRQSTAQGGAGKPKSEQRVERDNAVAERVFGRPSRLVAGLRADFPRRPDAGTGNGVARSVEALPASVATRGNSGEHPAVPAVPANTGPSDRDHRDDSGAPTLERPAPAKVS